jgi:formate hydrogenlyase subunit 6/NADH:ubiquinone oxidoreductase subunit I
MGIKWECIKHLFKKPFTGKYPKEKVILHPRCRGKIRYDSKECIGCSLCEKICPASAIKFYKKGRIDFDLTKCTFCGYCADACPKNRIIFTTEFEMADKDKKKLIVK